MDKTLIAGNSSVSFMRYCLRRGKATRWEVMKSIVYYLLYRYDLLDMKKAYRDSLRLLVGTREEDWMQFCQEWFEDAIRNLIYPEAVDIVRYHLNQGERVVIISSATTYAVAPLARYLNVPHVLATQIEVRQGLFTGHYIEPLCFRDGKVFWAEKIAEELGEEVDQSTFYTHSITDLPLLERVGTRQVVNPDPKLRSLAKKRGWPIRDLAPP